MKKLIIAVLVCFAILSCKKVNVKGRQMVTGRWELRKSVGGIAGTLKYEPGNGNVYVFDNQNHYQLLNTTSVVRSGTYEIKEAANTGDWLLQLQYFSNTISLSETDSIRFSENQLIFLPQAACCDIPTVFYDRVQ